MKYFALCHLFNILAKHNTKGDNMDDKTKCCLGIIVIFAIAAVFLFWPHPQEALKTDIDCYSHDADENGTGFLRISCTYYEDNESEVGNDLENATVEVNVTYENNTTVRYVLTTDSFGDAEINDLAPGSYNISARIVGNESYESSTFQNVREIGEYVAPTESEDYSSEYSSSSSDNYQTYTTTRYYWVYV